MWLSSGHLPICLFWDKMLTDSAAETGPAGGGGVVVVGGGAYRTTPYWLPASVLCVTSARRGPVCDPCTGGASQHPRIPVLLLSASLLVAVAAGGWRSGWWSLAAGDGHWLAGRLTRRCKQLIMPDCPPRGEWAVATPAPVITLITRVSDSVSDTHAASQLRILLISQRVEHREQPLSTRGHPSSPLSPGYTQSRSSRATETTCHGRTAKLHTTVGSVHLSTRILYTWVHLWQVYTPVRGELRCTVYVYSCQYRSSSTQILHTGVLMWCVLSEEKKLLEEIYLYILK